MERPKRRITSRCLEYNGGMLHEEELALRRALQASLTASKMSTQMQKSKKNLEIKDDLADKSTKASNEDKKQTNKSNPKIGEKKSDVESTKRKSAGGKDSGKSPKKQKRLLVRAGPKDPKKETGKSEAPKEECKQKGGVSKEKRKLKVDKSDKKDIKKKKKKVAAGTSVDVDDQKKDNESTPGVVRAQRKFAQNNPSSPRSLLLFQSQMQPLKARAKTEDFLDFLCLRGTNRLPKSLELFNSPCAPLSPLTNDEEDSSKTSPSKTSTNDQNSQSPHGSDGESFAKRSLNLGVEPATKSNFSSTSNSSVSSPVSIRVQPYAILPQFTNANYGALSNIPTPIPYPRFRSTPRSQGLDVYGAPNTGTQLPPSTIYHPCVSSVAMGFHQAPSCARRGEGFYPVSQCHLSASDGRARPTEDNVSVVLIANATAGVSNMLKKGNKSLVKSTKSPNKSPKKTKTCSKGTSRSPEKNPCAATNENQGLEEVPLFTPTEQEFKQPLKYIKSITPQAQAYGICAVQPPEAWKPDFCLSEDIRFTTKFQFVHRLGNRYPAVEIQLAVIRKHLELQDISLITMPQIAGCELDLPHMSKVVKEFGGLQQIIDKRKWGKVADALRIPKTAVERSTKLEQFYYKYLLSYDLLSEEEKNKLFDSVQNEKNILKESTANSSLEYTSKGRSVSLTVFQRTAKNVLEHHVKPNADVKDVEKTFWQALDEGQRYVVIHTAELPDNTAFPTAKGNSFTKSKWNLNVLPKIIGSAVRDLTGVDGISSPVVKLEMALSTSVWQTSPHSLYTIDYLHQGSDKIWYSIPSSCQEKFTEVVSTETDGKSGMKDRLMSPLSLLKASVPVYKVIQKPGQFIIKFPDARHSSLSSGYSVSESVSLAHLSHIQRIKASFQSIARQPKVDHLFSWERLIVSSLQEELRRNSNESTLNILIPELEQIKSHEATLRNEIVKRGVEKKTKSDDLEDTESSGKSLSSYFDPNEMIICEECNRFGFLSMVLDQPNKLLCLQHALTKLRQVTKSGSKMTFFVQVDESKLNDLLKEAKEKLQELQRKPKAVKRRVNSGSSGQKTSDKAS